MNIGYSGRIQWPELRSRSDIRSKKSGMHGLDKLHNIALCGIDIGTEAPFNVHSHLIFEPNYNPYPDILRVCPILWVLALMCM